ncbi:MAG: nitroreductase family protein [Candidatus Peribacteria bacterium]|jgi:nitroreductase|nr:nitroreductase family protein [Candidatus Peribacteria bacterium]
MQLIEAIKFRRSIRAFTQQPIAEADLQSIIECGMYAPSARNQQAWEFFILQSPEKKQWLGETLKNGKHQVMINQANTIIFTGFRQANLQAPEFIQQDMGACVQNMLLAAHDKGLGACRIGIYPLHHQDHSLNILLHLSEEITLFNAIVLGYPDPTLPL